MLVHAAAVKATARFQPVFLSNSYTISNESVISCTFHPRLLPASKQASVLVHAYYILVQSLIKTNTNTILIFSTQFIIFNTSFFRI